MAAPLGCFPGGVSPPGFPSSGNLISKPINTSKSFLFPNGVGSYFNLCSSSLVETAKSLDSSHHALRPVPKRGIVACIGGGAGIEPVAGSFLDPNPIKGWLIGILLSAVIPFFRHKFGSLMQIRNSIEQVEEVVHGLEKVAEVVDKVAEEIGGTLPDGSLKEAVAMVERAAEKADKSAENLGELIDKVEELGEKVEERVESLVALARHQAKEHTPNKSARVENS
ncbi:unnamed protein product [Cuscuta epithymum]|uniref:Uncharacterized protein n=1 Tax=Cuscuta epithymum TaxID=186058 RepID=A0AAV0DQX9_9ASTE|nr:unnamed protein product [Cuscuta epithymum]CAH9128726.1 unnamed protein product [Cuscuta epithymum]